MKILFIHTPVPKQAVRQQEGLYKVFYSVKYSVHAQLHSCKLQYQIGELVNMANSTNYKYQPGYAVV